MAIILFLSDLIKLIISFGKSVDEKSITLPLFKAPILIACGFFLNKKLMSFIILVLLKLLLSTIFSKSIYEKKTQ